MIRLDKARERLDELVNRVAIIRGGAPWTEADMKTILRTLMVEFDKTPSRLRSVMLALAILELAQRERENAFAV